MLTFESHPLDGALRILVVSRPGRSCDSLVSLLRTLRPQELFLVEPEALASWPAERSDPQLALIDGPAAGPAGRQALEWVRRRWPAARSLLLVETLRLAGEPLAGADCVMHRSAPAGDLLAAVTRLAQSPARPARPAQAPLFPLHTGLASGRR